MRKGKPGQDRVNELHANIFGKKPRPSEDGNTLHYAQQLVYLEESCQDIIAAIKTLETAKDDPDARTKAYEDLRYTLAFVARFADDRMLLETLKRSYSYQQRTR
jgi:hypothetical protein